MDILIGCGNSRARLLNPIRKDWVNLVTVDIDPGSKADVEWDLNNIPLPFSDSSTDEIHAYNVLEHTGSQGDYLFFFKQFEDFWRILKPDGFLCACVPDCNNVWTWGDPGHTRVINNGTISFLSQSAYDDIGKTARTDYRWCYKGNFSVVTCVSDGNTLYFILKAVK
jgi:hypothetical protein